MYNYVHLHNYTWYSTRQKKINISVPFYGRSVLMNGKRTKKGSRTVEKRDSHLIKTGDSRFLVSMQRGCTLQKH